nr:uncharacterized protein LOC119171541 [Rhipicephalus microplus]
MTKQASSQAKTAQTNQNHQRKAVDDLALTDIDTKDPSVIQKTSDSQAEYPRVAVRRIPTFPAHRTYDSFSPSDYNYENIQSLRRPSPVKMDNEVRYAELSLPRSKYPVRIRGAADRLRADRFPTGRRAVQRRAAAVRRGGPLRCRRLGHAAHEQPAAKRQAPRRSAKRPQYDIDASVTAMVQRK